MPGLGLRFPAVWSPRRIGAVEAMAGGGASMFEIVEILCTRTWWSWASGDRSWHSLFVHWFNLFEATVWWFFGGLVLLRFVRQRRSGLEPVYSAAFFTFGLTDLAESFALTSWLIWIKLLNLIALWWLRRTVMRRHYAASRVY